MAQNQAEAIVRRENGSAIIDLAGDINGFAEAVLNAAYDEAGQLNSEALVLNFGNVDYINSTGIALIVSILGKARKDQRKVVVYGLSEHYLEIFEITRLSDFMEIVADERAALAHS